jgi:hypothetical protein
MTEVHAETTDLKSQYAAQVTADLERNAKEQERLGAELAALQDQLLALQHDQALLESMRQALGGHTAAPADGTEPPSEAEPVAVPRQATAPKRERQQKKSGTTTRSKAKKSDTAAAAPADAAQPTLGELIRRHLADQPEPRSTAEITSALGDTHPDRGVKATVVRTTVEGLVAKGIVERTKQGPSVFYTTTAGHQNGAAAVIEPDTESDTGPDTESHGENADS